MIDLTPLEVRQKKGDFRKAFRGYDAELVNDFLDLVADRMEELVKENMSLKDSAAALEHEVVAYREKERALSDALMTAQKLREDARAHANKEGELMLREARLAADEAREEAARSLIREEETLRQVRARRGQLVASFRRLLERELSELAVIEETLELAAKAAPEAGAGAEGSRPARKPGQKPASGRGQPAGKESGGKSTSNKSDPATAEEPGEAAGEAAEAGTEDGEKPEGEEQADWLSSLVEE